MSGILSISKSIERGNLPYLKALHLSNNNIGSSGIEKLCHGIGTANKNRRFSYLEVLDISSNRISTRGTLAISEVLESLSLPNLKYINLGSNQLNDEDVHIIVNALLYNNLNSSVLCL